MEIDLSQFHNVFFEESLEGLESMEQELLNLEDDADKESINTIFRVAHSIKGGSATFNFNEIADFTHILETLLDQMREGERNVTREIIDLLLRSVDSLRHMLVKLQQGEKVDNSYLQLLHAFEKILKNEDYTSKSTDAHEAKHATRSTHEAQSPAPQTALKNTRWRIQFCPKNYILQTGNEPYRMFRELKGLGHLDSHVNLLNVPDFDQLDPESCYLSWTLTLDAEVEESVIREVFEWVEDDCDLTITSIASDEKTSGECEDKNRQSSTERQSNKAPPHVTGDLASQSESFTDTEQAKESASDNASKLITVKSEEKVTGSVKAPAAASIRVGTDKIDTLIDQVGELVITQSMLGELGTKFDMSKLNALLAGLNELEQNTRQLQESVMRIRMLPIGFVFNRLPRMVRDLSKQLGKKVDLQISGEATELDKTVMEQIGDPLTHLVRNALDHGIESVDERLESGKSEEGQLSLNAFHQGGNIVIEIADDGRGIDPDRIIRHAVNKGLVEADTELSHEQILALVMEPGFSTAETVSDISGRGVGMDVVKRNINNLGGSVEIDSQQGEGTRFTIRLPLTLAILDGQLVKIADEVYVIPLVSIIESIAYSSVVVTRIAGNIPVVQSGKEYLPIINLCDEFAIKTSNQSGQKALLAIVEGENRKIAIHIDALLGQQQVVIKSLDNHYQAIQGISGATILGDGKVALILDIVGLARRAAKNHDAKRQVA